MEMAEGTIRSVYGQILYITVFNKLDLFSVRNCLREFWI